MILISPICSRNEVFMNNSKTATQKHMTLDDRISIEKGLDQHLSLRSIALQLGKDPTTISKEIKKHRSFHRYLEIRFCISF
nr:MAG TPA: helix-turn-helix domain protein [Caudoviricetes sp.]